jgi:hypothetical protein
MKKLSRRNFLQFTGLTLGALISGDVYAAEKTEGRVAEQVKKSFFMPGEDLAQDEMRISFLGTSPIPRIAQAATSIFVSFSIAAPG